MGFTFSLHHARMKTTGTWVDVSAAASGWSPYTVWRERIHVPSLLRGGERFREFLIATAARTADEVAQSVRGERREDDPTPSR